MHEDSFALSCAFHNFWAEHILVPFSLRTGFLKSSAREYQLLVLQSSLTIFFSTSPKKMRGLLQFLFVAIFPLISGQNTVQTSLPGGALIKGSLINLDVRSYGVYKNIPYAEPTSQTRFQPAIMKTLVGEVNATGDSGPKCPQLPSIIAKELTEDCLHLDIYTPQRQPGSSLLPVMVWIHGGAFVMGSTQDYDPNGILRNLVSRGVIVVTINYRLGGFGFLVQPQIGVTGNLGLLDQILALKWVQRNIEAFGGDPRQVTIFGQSAGARSCSYLMLSPLARGLFSQAVLMSGAAWPSMMDHYRNVEAMSRSFIEKTGCSVATDVLGCLQAADLASLATAADQMLFTTGKQLGYPVFNDGNVLPGSADYLSKNRAPIPTIVGTTKDDTAFFDLIPIMPGSLSIVDSAEGMRAKIDDYVKKDVYGLAADKVKLLLKEEYVTKPLTANPKIAENGSFWFQQNVDMRSTTIYHMGAHKEAVSLQQKGANVFLYSFNYYNPNIALFQTKPGLNWTGSVHMSDLVLLFGLNDGKKPLPIDIKSLLTPSPMTVADLKIRDLFGVMWTNFAKTGNPSELGQVTWAQFRPGQNNYLRLDWPNLGMDNGYQEKMIHFWEKLENGGKEYC